MGTYVKRESHPMSGGRIIAPMSAYNPKDEEQAIYHALTVACKVAPFHVASYWTVDSHGGVKTAKRQYQEGFSTDAFSPSQLQESSTVTEYDPGIIPWVLQHEKALYVDDYQTHPLADPLFIGTRLYEACYVPIHVRDNKVKKLVGVLAAANLSERVGVISEASIALLESAVYQLQISLEHQIALQHLEYSLGIQSSIHTTMKAMTGARSHDELTDILFESFKRDFSTAAVFLGFLESQSTPLPASRSYGFHSLHLGRSLVYDIWNLDPNHETAIIPDLSDSRLPDETKTSLMNAGLSSCVITPLHAAGQRVGIIACFWKDRVPDSVQHAILELCMVFASVYTTIRETQHALATKIESLSTLGLALEARDAETYGHTQRVVKMMVQFIKAAGLDSDARDSGLVGAYLHDIGKIAIPDGILLKPGALTAEERAVIETHTLQGYNIAQRLPFVTEEALGIILSHHERWDGQGYPHRLGGTRIPLLARMFSLIDVYDALTHTRPYKHAWPVDQACTYIQEQAGSQFDPELTPVFLDLVKNGTAFFE